MQVAMIPGRLPAVATFTYKDAGVDIDAGDALVERLRPLARLATRPEVVADIGGFAGLCAIPSRYREPLLVSGTDGVGTKLKSAFATGRHQTVGIDLVAMSVNDVAVTGTEPLFFLDYFATGKLEVGVAESVIDRVAGHPRRENSQRHEIRQHRPGHDTSLRHDQRSCTEPDAPAAGTPKPRSTSQQAKRH